MQRFVAARGHKIVEEKTPAYETTTRPVGAMYYSGSSEPLWMVSVTGASSRSNHIIFVPYSEL
ncbi:hypothetical protein PKOR_08195 [Pontibacter korlensis]|uniref:Uncharacterized protein n=1 Tax=Pontibacter korlensis TaxID=400092 RepID=A0A0E3ZDI1_9BACT|nr:hypothetical protein PKOR_08195 [Pontibacter korlensis]